MNRYYSQRRRRKRRQQKMILCIVLLLFLTTVATITTLILANKKDTTTISKDNTTTPTPPLPTEHVPINTTPPMVEKPTITPGKGNSSDSSPITPQDKDVFSDSVFIGDSRTEGLKLNTGLKSATFLTLRGLNVSSAMTEKGIPLDDGSKGTILDGLKEHQYKKIFVMFGVNELGWPYTHTFIDKYKTFLSAIKELQPTATIYVQSIIPVTKEKSDKDSIYNNKKIKTFNDALIEMTKEINVEFLNVQEAVIDSNRTLPKEATTDGVHLKKEYCIKWLDYIKKNI